MVLRDNFFAEHLGAEICHVLLTLDSAHPQSFGSDFILSHKYANPCVSNDQFLVCGECVLQLLRRWPAPASLRIRDHTPTTLSLLPQMRTTMHAVYNSDSALLLAMIVFLARAGSQHVIIDEYHARA